MTTTKPDLTFEEAQAAILDDSMEGICLDCNERTSNVEPDAEGYTCESCGAPRVYGIEQALLMGLITIDGEIMV